MKSSGRQPAHTQAHGVVDMPYSPDITTTQDVTGLLKHS